MTVTLDGNTLTSVIIDVLFSEINRASIPKFVNLAPESTIRVWTEKPFKVTYILRATHALKAIIDSLLIAHTAVNLTDTTYSFNDNVWVHRIVAVWEGDINWASPWRIEVEVIKIT